MCSFLAFFVAAIIVVVVGVVLRIVGLVVALEVLWVELLTECLLVLFDSHDLNIWLVSAGLLPVRHVVVGADDPKAANVAAGN